MYEYLNLILTFTISIIALTIAFINLNPYKLSLKKLTCMLLLILICCIIVYGIDPPLSTIPLYIIPIIYIYTENHKFFESLLIGVLMSVVIILTDNFVSSIALYIFKETFMSSSIGHFITYACIDILLFIVTKFIGRFIRKYKDYLSENYNSKYIILLGAIIFITFALFYFNINWNNSSEPIYLTKINGLIFISYGIILTIICFVLLFFIKRESYFKYKQMQMDNLKEYTDNLEMLYTDMRKFRHDYINMIATMAGFIADRDMDALEKHFNENIYPLNNTINKNNYKLGLLKNIQMPEIKGLLSAKVIHAQEKGLNTILEIAEPIKQININIIDLSRIIGILLDNAIEASLESLEKRIAVAFINKNTSVIIVIINTCSEDIPPISKLFKQGFSTKGENRGLGLSNLKEIINKYDNVSLDTFINHNEFCQEITISNK